MQFDFTMSGEGLSLVANTADSVTELCDNIECVLKGNYSEEE